MDAGKLGLKIINVFGGTNELLEENGSVDWTGKVWDLRKDLSRVSPIVSNRCVLFLKHIGIGNLIAVVRPIGIRPEDCIIAWIYVPINLKISGAELARTVEFATNGIMQERLDKDAFRQFFSQTYEVLSVQCGAPSAVDNIQTIAYRYYGKGTTFTLTEILDRIHQDYYRKYQYVLLLDNASDQKVAEGDNLTSYPLNDYALMSPPAEMFGFAPFLDGRPFLSPRFVNSGERIQVIYKRKGFKDIEKYLSIDEKIEISSNEILRQVAYEDFLVEDAETKKQIQRYVLYINSRRLEPTRPLYLSDLEMQTAQVEIHAESYEDYVEKKDIRARNLIRLNRKAHKYVFQVRLRDGSDCRFEIKTPNRLADVPFKGYRSSERLVESATNYIEYKPGRPSYKRGLLMLLVALVLGGALGCGVTLLVSSMMSDNNEENVTSTQTTHSKPTSPTQPETKSAADSDESQSETDWDQIAEYLDKNAVWKRSEMEEFTAIKGLWDALNKRESATILEYKENLKKSKKFMRLVTAIEKNEKTFSKPYCEQDDYEITIEMYIGKFGLKTEASSTPRPDDGQNSNSNNNESTQGAWGGN